MILKATSVGELVQTLALGRARGTVRRVFRNSAYLESSEGLILLLRGTLRSPMTVNVGAGPDVADYLSVSQPFEIGPGQMSLGDVKVSFGGAGTFRSGMLSPAPAEPVGEKEILKGALALKLLYSVSELAQGLLKGDALRSFVDSVARPMSAGDLNQAYQFSNYVALLGTGAGFTPAGDDIVAGFTAAFNHYARGTGRKEISFPLSELKRRTVEESAFLVEYAQRGYVDEGLQALIISGLHNQPQQFRAQLSSLASRGHTSGLDMSLGGLLLFACVSDLTRHGRALESSLEALVDR